MSRIMTYCSNKGRRANGMVYAESNGERTLSGKKILRSVDSVSKTKITMKDMQRTYQEG